MKEMVFLMRNHRSFLMGLAMISVMLYHQRWFDGFFFEFFHRLGLFGVDVFLFLSGWGIFQSLSKNSIKTYFANRFWKIVPTCITIGCLEVFFRKLGMESGSDTLMVNLLTMVGLFKWYIYAIIVYYSIAPLLFRYVNTNLRMSVFFVLMVCLSFYVGSLGIEATGKSVFLTTMPIILYRSPGFLLGFWFAREESTRIPKMLEVSAFASIGMVLLFCLTEKQWYSNITGFVFAPLTIPAVGWLMYKVFPLCQKCGLLFCVSSVGVMSLDYYLWHEFLFIGWTNSGWFESKLITCFVALISTVLLANITHFLVELLRKKVY